MNATCPPANPDTLPRPAVVGPTPFFRYRQGESTGFRHGIVCFGQIVLFERDQQRLACQTGVISITVGFANCRDSFRSVTRPPCRPEPGIAATGPVAGLSMADPVRSCHAWGEGERIAVFRPPPRRGYWQCRESLRPS